MYYNSNITIFNKHDNNVYTSHLYGVFCNLSGRIKSCPDGVSAYAVGKIFVPFEVNSCFKSYLPQKLWHNTPDKDNYWTLMPGSLIACDIIKYSPDIYKNCDIYTVNALDICDFGSKHMHHFKLEIS